MTQHLRKGGQSRQISARSSWPWGIFTQLQGLLLSWGEHLRATIEHFLTSLLARAFKAEISSKPRILQPFESTNKDCRKRQVQFPRQAARDQEYLRCVQTVVLRDERVVAMIIVPEGKDIDIAILLFQRKSWCQPLPATTASQDTIIRAAVAPRQGGIWPSTDTQTPGICVRRIVLHGQLTIVLPHWAPPGDLLIFMPFPFYQTFHFSRLRSFFCGTITPRLFTASIIWADLVLHCIFARLNQHRLSKSNIKKQSNGMGNSLNKKSERSIWISFRVYVEIYTGASLIFPVVRCQGGLL